MEIKEIIEAFKNDTLLKNTVEKNLYNDKRNLMFWLVKHKYWRQFFVKMITEKNSHTKYEYTRGEILEILEEISPSSLDLQASGDGSSCCIVIKKGSEVFESGYFPIEYLDKVDEIGQEVVDPEDIKTRLARKEDRVVHLKERLAENMKRIEEEEKEIASLKSWLEKISE